MLILLVEVVCWAYITLGGHRRVAYARVLVAGYVIYLVSVIKIIKGGKNIVSDDFS